MCQLTSNILLRYQNLQLRLTAVWSGHSIWPNRFSIIDDIVSQYSRGLLLPLLCLKDSRHSVSILQRVIFLLFLMYIHRYLTTFWFIFSIWPGNSEVSRLALGILGGPYDYCIRYGRCIFATLSFLRVTSFSEKAMELECAFICVRYNLYLV